MHLPLKKVKLFISYILRSLKTLGWTLIKRKHLKIPFICRWQGWEGALNYINRALNSSKFKAKGLRSVRDLERKHFLGEFTARFTERSGSSCTLEAGSSDSISGSDTPIVKGAHGVWSTCVCWLARLSGISASPLPHSPARPSNPNELSLQIPP